MFKIPYIPTDTDKIHYQKNGFLVLRNMLTKEECEYIIALSYEIANDDYAAFMNPDRLDYVLAQNIEILNSAIDSSLKQKTLIIEKLKYISNYFSNLANRVDFINILEFLKDREIALTMTQYLYKQAKSKYASQAWEPHQDNAYPLTNDGYITTNFFLRNADRDNGTLYVYPKSHLNGLLDFDHQQSYREKSGSNPGNITRFNPDNYEKLDIDFNVGDLLIMNGNLIHGSYSNNSSRSRPLYSCSYVVHGQGFVPGQNASRRVIKSNFGY